MMYLKSTKMIEQADNTIGIQMYGVSLNLYCNYPELLEYLSCLLPGLFGPPCDSPDLEVSARWVTEPWEKGASLFSDSPPLNGLGKRMQIAKDELVWFDTHRDDDLQLRFRRHHNTPAFDVAYCYQPSAKKLAKYPNYKYKKFFDLMRYLVYFPIAWHLERTRGWVLIHASAVAVGDRAVLVAGPGGAGKTTTCIALVARSGMTLVTENLLFCDGSCIFPVLEPLRLTGESLALLNDDLKELKPIALPGGLRDKSMFWLSDGQNLQAARPVMLFVPQFSNRGFVRPISPGVACELLSAVNRLTLELNDYYWYTAALDVLWPQSGNAQRQLNVLKELTATTPCYTLGIDRSAGVEPVVNQILQYLHGSPETLLEEVDS
jgi:hypothetical protein